MRNAKLLIINTAVLTLGSFIMRTISVSFNVYLTNKIGASGMGLFQLIIAVYGLAVTFSGAGIKLGATRLVTDALSTGKYKPRKVMTLCIKYSFIIGSAVFIVLYICSGLIAKSWISDSRAEISLKILALSLPPISVSAALNGYFTARKTIIKFSGVQLAEQLTKIIVTVIAISFFGNTGLEFSCFAIALGITCSEIISALCSYSLYRFDSKKINSHCGSRPSLSNLLHISVPDAVGASFRAILLTVEHLLIPKGFKKSGQTAEESVSIYGLIHGMALPIVLYPSAVITSLSSLLVPELSKYKLFNNRKMISYVSSTVLKLSLMFSIGVSCFLFFFSDSVSMAVFNSDESAYYLKLLSVLIPVMYSDIITDGLLKGLDCQAASMKYNIFDSALCVILVYFILPKYAIRGYIFILFISEIINFSLSINKLSKETTLKLNIYYDIVKPVICGCGCCSITNLIFRNTFIGTFSHQAELIILIISSSIMYFGLIYFTDCIKKKDLNYYRAIIKNKSYA